MILLGAICYVAMIVATLYTWSWIPFACFIVLSGIGVHLEGYLMYGKGYTHKWEKDRKARERHDIRRAAEARRYK